MRIVFIGAGRLATNLARALHDAGHTIEAVYSRTLSNAEALSQLLSGQRFQALQQENNGQRFQALQQGSSGQRFQALQQGSSGQRFQALQQESSGQRFQALQQCTPVDAIPLLPRDADVYILAVKDDALPALIAQLHDHCPDRLLLHTAGSVPMSVFGNHEHHGVFYPMQTFSKERQADFSRVHIFIEGSTPRAIETARQLAASIGSPVTELSSEQRKKLHLAAVFACNFTNHCYALAEKILATVPCASPEGLPFDVMLPLIDETTAKVHTMSPRQAQTGPAIRYDQTIISSQSELLANDPLMQQVYDLMSKSIHRITKE